MTRLSYTLSVPFLLSLVWGASLASAQINVSTEIVSSSVALVWQADTFVPPFYAGKALAPLDATVRVFAFPDTSFGNPSTATYAWKLNGQVLGSDSGTGRSSLLIPGSSFASERLVVVEVTSADGSKRGTGVARIESATPKLMLYQETPLAGTFFSHAIGDDGLIIPTETDVSVGAYPFFFSTPSRSGLIAYSWTVNGDSVNDTTTQRGTLMARGEEVGTSTVQITAMNPSRILQRASETFNIFLK